MASQSGRVGVDPVEEGPITPKKAKGSMNPAAVMARHYQSDPFAKTPLNVAGSHFKFPLQTPESATGKKPRAAPGTQFVLPSNPDPEIVAQLPKDIRARLMEQGNASGQQSPSIRSNKSRSQSPAIEEALQDQIDPEVFNALPDDIKAEILAQYGRHPQPQPQPQSRVPEIPSPLPKKKSPVKRGVNAMFRAAERRRDAEAGLMQTNFLGPRTTEQPATESELEELDLEILAELPEDLRREIMEDHRRRRLASKSGLNVNTRRATNLVEDEDSMPQEQALLVFPELPTKMEFGRSGLRSQQEIKDMLDAWHSKTTRSGPHRVDVEVFEKYLSRVVLEERNMDKVVGLVKWLEWIVDAEKAEGKGKQAWMKAVRSVKDAVQKAVQQRGLRALNI
jgi:DNA repair protein REV1